MPDYTTEDIDPSQSTLSPNFANYIYNMLAKGEQAANLPYQPYTGERYAGPSGLQEEAFRRYQNLAEPSQFGEATGIARLAASRAGNLSYTPGQFNYQNITPQALQQYQMSQPQNIGAERVGTRDIQAAQTGYRPDLRTFQMQGPQERVTSESFTQPGTAGAYMSPYMQQVVNKQTREATRQADIARGGRRARYAQAGAFGGSRQAIEEAESERNLQQQLGDIQATGSQAAFQQAQQQFNAEQQARQAAQQANIGTGLTVGQQNLAAQLGVQQLGTQAGLQTALANLTNQQQAAVQNEANRLQASGMNQQEALRAAMANQQMGFNVGQQNLNALLGIQQLGSGQNLQAQQLNQQAGLEAQRLGEQSRQFGYGQGMQGIGQLLGAGQLMSGIGSQAGQYGLSGLQGLLGAGGVQQGFMQQPLDFGYQQWQESQKFPYQQATYMQSLLGGLPLGARPYDSGQSGWAEALKGGLAGLGLYNATTPK